MSSAIEAAVMCGGPHSSWCAGAACTSARRARLAKGDEVLDVLLRQQLRARTEIERRLMLQQAWVLVGVILRHFDRAGELSHFGPLRLTICAFRCRGTLGAVVACR